LAILEFSRKFVQFISELTMISCRKIVKCFGELQVLNEIDLSVQRG